MSDQAINTRKIVSMYLALREEFCRLRAAALKEHDLVISLTKELNSQKESLEKEGRRVKEVLIENTKLQIENTKLQETNAKLRTVVFSIPDLKQITTAILDMRRQLHLKEEEISLLKSLVPQNTSQIIFPSSHSDDELEALFCEENIVC